MKDSIIKNKRKPVFVQLCSIFIILGIWQVLSLNLPSILIPSPKETVLSLFSMFESGELAAQIAQSALRMIIGLVIGMTIAIICGLIAGTFPIVYDGLRPVVSLLLGLPPIIVVVLAMVWFGTGSTVPIFVVSLLVFPSIFLNTADGWRNIDKQLLEMASLYKSPFLHTLRHIIFPALAVPIFTAVSLATGSAVRITIMAELLGANEGIGYSLALARVNIDTAKVFAWTLISVLIIVIIDHLIIHPLKRVAFRWNMD